MNAPREKVDLSMSTMELMLLMSEGNPGAGTVLAQLNAKDDGMMTMIHLDDMNIRGSQLWIAYKNVCGQDLELLVEYVKERNPEMVRMINEEILRSDPDCTEKAVERGASFEMDSPRRMT